MDQQEFTYRAFISYSHRDKAWGDWLHKTLETYRTPARLVGRASRDGTVPKRLYPVFRDRDELPSSASLGDNIDAALRESLYLVVICSPHAAVSRWVDGEIRAFKKLGREGRVLCLIVDGEPNASDRPDSGELECFPPALRYRVDAKGELTQERTEPIAADARPGKDGKTNARFKILAGLLGVGYDELRQREKQRRFWRRVQTAVASLALLAVLAGGWYWEAQQKTRQALVAQYTEQGRQLFVDGKPLQAAVYLSEAYRLGGRSPALRFLMARSLRYVEALRATVPAPGLFLSGGVSRDGSRMVVATGTEKAEVRDTKDGHLLLTLHGKGAMLIGVAFSPDGRYLWGASKPDTMSRESSVDVWDAPSGKLLHSLDFPDSFLVLAAFDGTGARMLTRDSRHNLVQIWDTATGKELFRLPTTAGDFEHAGFSPDGRYIVTVQKDNSLHIWDGADGRPEHVLRGHTAEVTNFSFSQDSRLLATVSKDKSAQVWELATGTRLTKIAQKNPDDYEGGHSDAVNDTEFTIDGKQLITASKDKSARVWDVATGKLVSDLGRMDEEATGLSISRDGRYATVNGKDTAIWLWDLKDHTLRAALRGTGAAFLPDGKTLVTFDTPNAVVQVWDVATLAENHSVAGEHMVFSPDQSRLLTVDFDVVNVRKPDGTLLKAIQLPPDPKHPENKTYAQDTEWSPDGARFLVQHAEYEDVPGLWDASGKPLAVLKHGIREVSTAAFTPDGRRVYSCGQDVNWKPRKGHEDERGEGRVGEFWDVTSMKPLSSFPMPDGCVDFPHFNADGSRMVGTVREDDTAKNDIYYHAELWDLAAGKRVARLPGRLEGYYAAVAFTPDQRELLSATVDGVMHVWDPATGTEQRHWDTHGSGVETMLYSPDGTSLLTAHRDGTVQIWDAASNLPRWQLKEEQFGASKMTYSPDGAFLLMQGSSKPPRILDAMNGTLLMELPGDSHLTEHTAYSPRGDLAITGAYDSGLFRLWDVSLEMQSPAEVSALVRCRVRWQLQAGQLVPAAVDPKSCAASP